MTRALYPVRPTVPASALSHLRSFVSLQQQSGCRSVSGGTYGTNEEVPTGTASRENATAGVRSFCDRPTGVAWRRETGGVQLPGLYAHLRKEKEQRTIYCVAADDTQKTASEAERGKSRTSATHARTHPRTGQVVASGGAGAHPVLRCASEHLRAVSFGSRSGGSGIARCRGAVRTVASFGIVCGASSLAGFLCLLSVIPILCSAWALLPKARAGCGKSACPDPWRGL